MTKAAASDSCVDRDVMTALVHDAERKARRSGDTYAVMSERLKDPQEMARFVGCLIVSQVKGHTAGWQIVLSLDLFACGTKCWHGSAMLWPQGRCSTQEDWQNLGTLVTLSGAPPSADEQIQRQLETIHPNRPHHWWWQELDETGEEGEN